MAKILILGGYGAVGREAATALVRHASQSVIVVAGRNPHTAQPLSGTTSMRVDASNPSDMAEALTGVDAVLMCAERDNARVARACLERGIDYLDVSASHDVLAAIEDLDDVARRHDATAVLSVGLAPGITNLLARHCVELSPTREVHIGLLLGSGEQHGRGSALLDIGRAGPTRRLALHLLWDYPLHCLGPGHAFAPGSGLSPA
jgi:saccharopine dehydrogenase-like NADP-dependent oxidoreductase